MTAGKMALTSFALALLAGLGAALLFVGLALDAHYFPAVPRAANETKMFSAAMFAAISLIAACALLVMKLKKCGRWRYMVPALGFGAWLVGLR